MVHMPSCIIQYYYINSSVSTYSAAVVCLYGRLVVVMTRSSMLCSSAVRLILLEELAYIVRKRGLCSYHNTLFERGRIRIPRSALLALEIGIYTTTISVVSRCPTRPLALDQQHLPQTVASIMSTKMPISNSQEYQTDCCHTQPTRL